MDPQIDHLYGRTVLAIEDDSENPNTSIWRIRLDGDALIQNYAEKVPMPSGIEGTVLLSSESRQRKTRLTFGYSGEGGNTTVGTVDLNNDSYTVIVPGNEPTEDITAALPEDPTSDRVVDGPDPDWKPEGTPDEAEETAETTS